MIIGDSLSKQINPLRTSRNGPINLAPAFADDCIFFASANKESNRNLKDSIIDFCAVSGQELNTNVCNLFFSHHL